MPQIHMIVSPSAKELFQGPDDYDDIAISFIEATEIGFDLQGKNDVAFTAVNAVSTIREADVQIEVQYTAGENEHHKGRPFNPSREEQEKVADMIRTKFISFCLSKGKSPLSLSVWCKPYHDGLFRLWKRD